MSDRELLIEEAKSLGLEFPSNIKTTKLAVMVEEAGGSKAPVEDTLVMQTPEQVAPVKPADKRSIIKAARDKAMATRIVTLTNKDSRESDVATTAFLSFENQFFGLAKVVPLDVPVELEQGLIDVAVSTNITLHKDEIIKGRRTGNKVPVNVKKFAISYADQGQ